MKKKKYITLMSVLSLLTLALTAGYGRFIGMHGEGFPQ